MTEIDEIMAGLTKDSVITIDRPEADVFVDGEHVLRCLDEDPQVFERHVEALHGRVAQLRTEAGRA